ncbi:MAG TPA: hypothetical protein PK542_08320 [Treponemataceae bacterium]|nr:hypothetical protein [Treponemataceae bacterium]HPS44477.1 hypothetical protein [Treponemataceae bacterium]
MIDRERIEEFVELHRIQLVVALSAFLALLALIIIFSISSAGRYSAKKRGHAKTTAGTVSVSDFWLPEEPLQVPGVQLFREGEAKWSPAEIKRWYTVPDTQALGELRSAGKKSVDAILESVP